MRVPSCEGQSGVRHPFAFGLGLDLGLDAGAHHHHHHHTHTHSSNQSSKENDNDNNDNDESSGGLSKRVGAPLESIDEDSGCLSGPVLSVIFGGHEFCGIFSSSNLHVVFFMDSILGTPRYSSGTVPLGLRRHARVLNVHVLNTIIVHIHVHVPHTL